MVIDPLVARGLRIFSEDLVIPRAELVEPAEARRNSLVIAGTCLGVVGLLLFVGTLVTCYYRRRSKKNKQLREIDGTLFRKLPTSDSIPNLSRIEPLPRIQLDSREVSVDEIQPLPSAETERRLLEGNDVLKEVIEEEVMKEVVLVETPDQAVLASPIDEPADFVEVDRPKTPNKLRRKRTLKKSMNEELVSEAALSKSIKSAVRGKS